MNALDFKFSNETGKALEQAVFLELKRREKEIYFFREKSECDFIVKQGFEITEAIQVSASISNAETRTRELRGLTDCCKKFGLKQGLIITLEDSNEFEHNGIMMTTMPLYRWLLRE